MAAEGGRFTEGGRRGQANHLPLQSECDCRAESAERGEGVGHHFGRCSSIVSVANCW